MQYGQSAPMWYTLAINNQCTNTTPSKAPAFSANQYHRFNFAPISNTVPVVISTGKAAKPTNGLEKPNKCDSLECITEPQLITGLRLQLGLKFGSASSCIWSYIMMNDASNPNAPATMNIQGKAFSKFTVFNTPHIIWRSHANRCD